MALNAGATNQPISIKLDVAQPKGLPHASAYQCEVDRIFDTDVSQMKPLPETYLQPSHKMTVGAPPKDLHLQMNSVSKVGGKL